MKPHPDQCRCSDALLVCPTSGIVSRVQSCPACIGGALRNPLLVASQMDLFSPRGGVSVSAVLTDEMDRSDTYKESPERYSDGLPF